MSKSFNLTYFGNIRALATNGSQIGFVTEHEEGFPTALFLIDAESHKLSSVTLPCGGLSLARLGDTFWVGGTDGNLYSATHKDKTATKSKAKIPSNAKKLVAISDTEIVCLCDESVVVIASGKVAQTLELTAGDEADSPTAVHANPDATWLAIGGLSGHVSVYQREEQDQFELSESAALHQGEVTSILFEPEELRFFSAGVDQKLLHTHARGTLEPEDRGRANNHDQRVTSMLLAGEGRFITGSLDKTCKSWARVGATQPSTLSKAIVAVTDLSLAMVHNRSMLVAAQSDNSIRLFLIDEAGKFVQANDRYNDVYFRANELLESNSASDRGVALHDLATLDDVKSIRLIANRIGDDNDAKLRMTAVELLCKSKHPKHREQLLLCLGNLNEPVRRSIFEYLAKTEEDSNELLALCNTAISGDYADIGCEAVKVLQKLSTSKSESDSFGNRARGAIVDAIESKTVEIRRSAVLALESVYDKGSARANLIAMQSKQADSRRIGLIRLMQRKLLGDADAAAGIRRKIEDADADVRKTACLLLVLSSKKLADAIRERDDDINRQLSDLESFTIDVGSKKSPAAKAAKPKVAASKTKKKSKLAKPKLADADYQPLLIAVASRSMDTCLMGAKCLARLEDPRAFGLLMQLSRESDESARVDACNALAALGDPRANDRLAAMLADNSIAVRDAAYSALSSIGEDDPVAVASNGLAAKQEDVRRRGLDTLIRHIRKAKPKSIDDEAVQLLLQSLNDSESAVRGEAFKFILNSKIGGSGDKCLRLGLSSSHGDIRREVLNETLGQKKEKWAPALMLDLLDDPDESLRAEVFAVLKKEKKDSDIEWLGDAIGRKYADIRELACKKLVSNRTAASRDLLLNAIDDDKPANRQLVLQSLVFDGAVDRLVEALDSSKIDVKLGAANALARFGDLRAKDALIELVKQEAPTVESLQIEGLKVADLESFVEVWRFSVTGALDGLAMLGDASTIDYVKPELTMTTRQCANMRLRHLPGWQMRKWRARFDRCFAMRTTAFRPTRPLRSRWLVIRPAYPFFFRMRIMPIRCSGSSALLCWMKNLKAA
jgi:ParB family chromosome partitioning protein